MPVAFNFVTKASEARRTAPPKVVWKAPGVVGKLLDWYSGDVGVAGGVHGDASAPRLARAAAEVGGVDQGRAGGIQLGHEGIVQSQREGRLEGPGVVGKIGEGGRR